MKKNDLLLLVLLASIWGSSFMFMRIISPVLGPVVTASVRLLIGGFFLIGMYKILGIKLQWKQHWKLLLFIGIISQGIPYFLYAFAALYIPSNISVIMNSTTPIFGLILSVIFLDETFTLRKLIGIVLGTTGVVLISTMNNAGTSSDFFIGIVACLGAAFLYGVNGVFVKSKAKHLDSRTIASFSQIFAGLSLLPFITFFPPTGVVTVNIIVLLLVFGVVCSGIAGLIYFKLIIDVGPVKALTVTYLMPLFGFIWGAVLLNEAITWSLVLGGLIIVLGIILITGKKRVTI